MSDTSFDAIEKAIAKSPALKDKSDERDLLSGSLIAGAIDLPATLDNRAICSPVRNQGSRGTCVAHATLGVKEIFDKANLSEEYLFKRIKEIDAQDYGYDGYGAYMRSGAKAIERWGACTEDSLPYDGSQPESYWQQVQTTDDMDVEAQLFKAKAYASVPVRIDDIKRAVLNHKAVLGGFMLHESYRQAKTNGGYLPLPKIGEKKIGGHAMTVVGWTSDHFILKNSWGTSWGDSGYLYCPFSFIRSGHAYSFWSLVDLDKLVFDAAGAIEDLKKNGVTGYKALDIVSKSQETYNRKRASLTT